MKPLFSLLKNDPVEVDLLSVEQVLALCGNGKLTDGSSCSLDFREYLQIATRRRRWRWKLPKAKPISVLNNAAQLLT
jgi:hypothetical protein